MFERRVKFLLVLLAVPAVALAARLVHLQVFSAAEFRTATDKMLELRPRQFPFLRGSITDCAGRPLAYDAPAWDVAVHYGVLVDEPAVRKRMSRIIGVPLDELTPEMLDASWHRISQLTGTSVADMQADARRIVARIKRIKRHVSERRGVETLIAEEIQSHPVVTGLDQSQQVAARIGLSGYPWVEVVPSHTRRYEGGPAVGHLTGRVVRVSDAVLEADENADDPLAAYRPEDVYGVRGVEALGERWLRGRRGQVWVDRLGDIVTVDRAGRPLPPIEAVDGKDLQLTLDLALQQALYARLGAEITTRYPASTGGAAVLLDIPTRQVIALLSYPSIDPNDRTAMLEVDPNDPRRPFLFRAVREIYNPGSIVKPMLLAAGLADGTVHRNTHFTCTGHLLPGHPNKWRCTGIHGAADPIYAIQHSCNIFFYHLGQQMGVPREAWWMQQFGLGHTSGTGLLDESVGRLPSRRTNGEARFAAIGQSETELTPIQAANMIATIASGEYRPVTVWANDPAPRPEAVRLNVPDSAWRIVREGLYRTVNEPGGTAYRDGKLAEPGGFVLLGKTGSAEGYPPEWFYTCRFPDGTVREIRARNQRTLLSDYPPERRPTVLSQRKPPEYEQTHGWFVGYLVPRDRYLQDVTGGDMRIAIAVVVEYAGHGGEVAVPVATAMLDSVMMAGDSICSGGDR